MSKSAGNPAVSVPPAILSTTGGNLEPREERWFEGNLSARLNQARSLSLMPLDVWSPSINRNATESWGTCPTEINAGWAKESVLLPVFLMCIICLKLLTWWKCPTGHIFEVLTFEKGTSQEGRGWEEESKVNICPWHTLILISLTFISFIPTFVIRSSINEDRKHMLTLVFFSLFLFSKNHERPHFKCI